MTKKNVFIFFEEKCLPYIFHIWKLYDWHFFDGNTKNFPSKLKFAPIFFQLQIDFCTQTNLFLKKLHTIQFPYMEIVGLAFFFDGGSNFEMSPDFFLSTANGFLYANKLFPKTNFLHAKLNFYSYFFVWRVYVCLFNV